MMRRKNLISSSGISANILPVSVIRFSGGLHSLRTAGFLQKPVVQELRLDPVWSAMRVPAGSGICITPKIPDIITLILRIYMGGKENK